MAAVATRRSPASLLALAALLLVLAGGFQPYYVRLLLDGTSSLRAVLVELPYRRAPGLRELLVRARDLSEPGERIVVLAPADRWGGAGGGYRYVYGRAMYALAGRQVLPLIDDAERPVTHSREADLALVWHARIPPEYRVLFRNEDGAVARRAR